MTTPVEPTGSPQRQQSLDVLRGFALMGIFAANIYIYDLKNFGEVEASFEALTIGPADAPFFVFTAVFILNKMMALFSILFGAGILLLVDRVEERQSSAFRIHYTRNSILAGIGLLHSLIWFGDVLLVYALCAFLLYPVRGWSTAKFFRAGSFMWLAVLGASFWSGTSGIVLGAGLRALSMMLFGMAFYRSGLLTLKRSADWYRLKSRRLLGLGIPVCALGWGLYDFDKSLSAFIHNLGVPFVAMGYVCFVMKLLQRGEIPKITNRLSAAGQMALTNYLLQTVLGTIFVAGVNEFRGERLTVIWMMLITLAIWLLQLSWSLPWMKQFHYGPVEWLWRSLTYRKTQPFKLRM